VCLFRRLHCGPTKSSRSIRLRGAADVHASAARGRNRALVDWINSRDAGYVIRSLLLIAVMAAAYALKMRRMPRRDACGRRKNG